MRIGVPRETKDREFRVGAIPDGVRAIVAAGHEVWVEQGAGEGSGFPDDAYAAAGAKLVSRDAAWSEPELVVKVKEPSLEEASRFQSGQTLLTYLHLAAAPELTEALRAADIYALAYETIRHSDGPMASRTVSVVASHPSTSTPSNSAARFASARRRLVDHMQATY